MNFSAIPRRRLIARGVGLAAATALVTPGVSGSVSSAYAADAVGTPPPVGNAHLKEALRKFRTRQERTLTGRPSANRWEMHQAVDVDSELVTCQVPGTGLSVALRAGDVETVLIHVIRRFHYEVDTLFAHEPRPLHGWIKPSEVRDSRLPESNQASGTAVAIRPDSYPPNSKGNFTAGQEEVIRDILADIEGVVRWGGHDRRPYEALFYLDLRPGNPRLASVAAKIRAWNETPGAGAGVLVDTSLPSRQRQSARYM
ncbi:hypothetical protein [Streptomyces sp. R08]|uniref:Secreted protein n=1 Tax=Streptomyces sp. R08 TaxID=3238624 RepID=A0AB39M7T0_9ACTN